MQRRRGSGRTAPAQAAGLATRRGGGGRETPAEATVQAEGPAAEEAGALEAVVAGTGTATAITTATGTATANLQATVREVRPVAPVASGRATGEADTEGSGDRVIVAAHAAIENPGSGPAAARAKVATGDPHRAPGGRRVVAGRQRRRLRGRNEVLQCATPSRPPSRPRSRRHRDRSPNPSPSPSRRNLPSFRRPPVRSLQLLCCQPSRQKRRRPRPLPPSLRQHLRQSRPRPTRRQRLQRQQSPVLAHRPRRTRRPRRMRRAKRAKHARRGRSSGAQRNGGAGRGSGGLGSEGPRSESWRRRRAQVATGPDRDLVRGASPGGVA